jgi:DNA repair protein RAD50
MQLAFFMQVISKTYIFNLTKSKTTIIECLKYATTADLPPLCKGGAFVFDPKLLDEIETKGRIKLHLRTSNNQLVQVQKNLMVTQKAKKVEFRTLETVISRYDKDLKLLSTITSKCINADHEIITALGVSRAVIDNVIFCHQEDSNWPLSDGKTLKTKFDEIFSATKYIKALDALRKIKVEKQHSVKQFETEKKHLEIYKSKADDLSAKLSEHEAKRDACEAKVQYIKEKLKPIEDSLEEFNKNARRINELHLQLDSAKNEKYLLEKQLKEIEAMIKVKFQGKFFFKTQNFIQNS